jgi:Fibrobacter succinogenes major domain (Fib_succ_major).
MDLSVEYDCSEYKCVTTEYLNQDLLDSGMYGQFLDVRDSQVYRTIEIGSQIWMAQNLNFETEESACYDNQDSNCVIYGRLYYQTEALTACPPGWHLPSNEEWNALDSIVHSLKVGNDGNGNYLKSLSTWTGETGTTNLVFRALLVSILEMSMFVVDIMVYTGLSDTYRYRCLLNDKSSLYAYYEIYAKDWGMAVRCLLGDVETSSD